VLVVGRGGRKKKVVEGRSFAPIENKVRRQQHMEGAFVALCSITCEKSGWVTFLSCHLA